MVNVVITGAEQHLASPVKATDSDRYECDRDRDRDRVIIAVLARAGGIVAF